MSAKANSKTICKTPGKATIKDLCLEDKKKIGKLIKRLAQEREEKENLLRRLEEMQIPGAQSQLKQQCIQSEIDRLDKEISQLQEQQESQPPIGQQHQSPNFKVLEEASSSLILPLTQRDSPVLVDQMIQTSLLPAKKNSASNKKQVLMQKIHEFEKIVNRLNFSSDQSIELTQTNRKSEDPNSSYLQSVYQKLLNLESQLQSMPAIQPQSTERIQEQFHQQYSEYQEQNEDDLVIQLLNSDGQYNPVINSNRKPGAESVQNKFQNPRNSSQPNKSKSKQDMGSSKVAKIQQEAYCRNVLQKYTNILQELNK